MKIGKKKRIHKIEKPIRVPIQIPIPNWPKPHPATIPIPEKVER